MLISFFSCEKTRGLKNFSRSERGFTLVEIMIVLAILGSIFALLAGRFGGARDKARIKEAQIQIGQIVNALSMYQNDCGKYPQTLENLQKPDANCSSWGPEPYYKQKLSDPWGTPYVYELQGSDFRLKSYGKGGKEGGSGFEKDITSDEESGAGAPTTEGANN